MIENQHYGYDFRSRQPCAIIDQKLVLGSLANTENIDAWLAGPFQIEIAKLVEDERELEEGQVRLALAAANRALVLYGELVRASRIPSFERGRVLRLAKVAGESNSYRATVALPVVDRLPIDLFAKVFRASVAVVLDRLNVEPTPDAARELFAHLDEQIIGFAKKRSPFESAALAVCRLAYEQDTPLRHVGRGVMRLGWGARSRLLYRSSIEQDSAVGAQACGSKRHTVLLLGSAGFPVPEHRVVDTGEAALDAALQLGWPVVVKPEHAARAEGVTVNVRSEQALQTAFDKAQKINAEVLIEREVPGVCHRITVAGDRIIYVIKRLSKGVIGDGRSTVTELVDKANAGLQADPPWRRLREFPLDALAVECLANDGLDAHSIPAEGQRVSLRPHATDEWGGDTENLTGRIHKDNARLAIDAVRIFGLAIAGVDLMTTDITRPWHENGAVILEVNYMPQISLWGRKDDAAALFPALMKGDGRIPVHLVTGEGDLLAAAKALKSQLGQQGRRPYLTSAGHTEDAEGQEVVMALSMLFDRSFALVMRKDVEELILAGEPSEIFAKGLVVDQLESVHIVDDDTGRGDRTAREIRTRFVARTIRKVQAREGGELTLG